VIRHGRTPAGRDRAALLQITVLLGCSGNRGAQHRAQRGRSPKKQSPRPSQLPASSVRLALSRPAHRSKSLVVSSRSPGSSPRGSCPKMSGSPARPLNTRLPVERAFCLAGRRVAVANRITQVGHVACTNQFRNTPRLSELMSKSGRGIHEIVDGVGGRRLSPPTRSSSCRIPSARRRACGNR